MIPFRLRIRETDLINDGQKQLPAKTVYAHLQPGQQEILNSRRACLGKISLCISLKTRRWRVVDCDFS